MLLHLNNFHKKYWSKKEKITKNKIKAFMPIVVKT